MRNRPVIQLSIGAAVLAAAVLGMLVYADSVPIGRRGATGLYTYVDSFNCLPVATDPNDPNTATAYTGTTTVWDSEDASDCALMVVTETLDVDPNADPNAVTITYTMQTSPKEDPNGGTWATVKAWSARSVAGIDSDLTQRALFRYHKLGMVVADSTAILTSCTGTIYAECRQ